MEGQGEWYAPVIERDPFRPLIGKRWNGSFAQPWVTGSGLPCFEFNRNAGLIMDPHYRTPGKRAVALESLQSLFSLKSAVYLWKKVCGRFRRYLPTLATAISAQVFRVAALEIEMGLAIAFLVEVVAQLRGKSGVHLGLERIEAREEGQQVGRVRFLLPRHGGKVFVEGAGEALERLLVLRGVHGG